MKLTKVKKAIATITAIAGLGTGILTATAASVGNPGGEITSPIEINNVTATANNRPIRLSVSDNPNSFPPASSGDIVIDNNLHMEVTITGSTDTAHLKPGGTVWFALSQTPEQNAKSHFPAFSCALSPSPELVTAQGEQIGTVTTTDCEKVNFTFNNNISHYTGRVNWKITLHGTLYQNVETREQYLSDTTTMIVGNKYIQFPNTPTQFIPATDNNRYLMQKVNGKGFTTGWLTWNSFGTIHNALTKPDDPATKEALSRPRVLLTHVQPTSGSDPIINVSMGDFEKQMYWAANDTSFAKNGGYEVVKSPWSPANVSLNDMRSISTVSQHLPAGSYAIVQDTDKTWWVAANFGTIGNALPLTQVPSELDDHLKRDPLTKKLMQALAARHISFPQHEPPVTLTFANPDKVNRVDATVWNSWDSNSDLVHLETATYSNSSDGTQQGGVIYHSNYGEDTTIPDVHSLPYQGKIQPALTRHGYDFTGWNTRANGSGTTYQPGQNYTYTTSNLVLYAQWKRSTTTISYSANGGTGSVPSHTGDIGSPVTIASGFTRTGYTMTGYIGSDGQTYQVGQQVNQPDSDVELRAQWERKHVMLTIQPNGADEQPVTLTYDYGDRALPAVPWRRDGYILTGLTRSPQGGDNVSELTMTENTVLYAQWQAATHWYTLTPAHPTVYHVTVNPNGGLGDPLTADGHHGDTVSIPDGGYTRTGYHADGYSLTPDCAVKLTGNTVTLTASTTVYQCWTVNTHQLTLNPNGGQGEPRMSTHNEGDTVSIPANPFTRDHYTFTGWSLTPDGSQPAGNPLRMDRDMTLYAQWKKDTVRVTLDMNGGNGQPQVNTVDYGDQFTPNTRPTRDGYKFNGWNTTADGSGVNITTLTATADTVLYAQWRRSVPMTGLTPAHKTSHKLTVDPNGGDGEPVELTGTHGDTVTIPDTTFTRNGYHKNGYSLTPDCAVKLDKPEVKLTKDTTVYQCWEKNPEPKPEPQPQQVHKPEPEDKSTPTPAQQTSGEEKKLATTGSTVSSIALLAFLFTAVGLASVITVRKKRHHKQH